MTVDQAVTAVNLGRCSCESLLSNDLPIRASDFAVTMVTGGPMCFNTLIPGTKPGWMCHIAHTCGPETYTCYRDNRIIRGHKNPLW